MEFISLYDLMNDPPPPVGNIWGDDKVSLIPKRGLTLLHSGSKMGKAQPLSSYILTPTGFKLLAEINVGDFVTGRNGEPTRVTYLHPISTQDVYEVKFSDGTTVECTREHLWNIRRNGKIGKFSTVSTEKLLNLVKSKHAKFYVPTVAPVQFAPLEDNLEISPYLLGVLLGDGCFTMRTPVIAFGDDEIVNHIFKEIPTDTQLAGKLERCVYISKQPGASRNALTDSLTKYGLMSTKSDTKFIPAHYLFSSVEQRFALLQGLMDTDGTVNKNVNGSRGLSFCTVSLQLAEDVVHLVGSLGGVAKVKWRKTYAYTKQGRKVGKPAAVININLPNSFPVPFRLSRKIASFTSSTTKRKKEPVRYVASVTLKGAKAPCRCITVENADGLYVTENFIVTHNSMLLKGLAIAGARGDESFLGIKLNSPFTSLIFQGEIHLRGIYERVDTMLGQAFKSGELSEEQLKRIVFNKKREERLSDDATFLEFQKAVREIQPDFIGLDPLAHVLTTNENDNAVVGAMLERLATLRDDPGAAILLVHHDAKVNESTALRSPQQRARGADRLNADPDCILSLAPGERLATGPTGTMHVASRYGRSIAPMSLKLNEDTLWFENYVAVGDVRAFAIWISATGCATIEEEALIAIVEKEWGFSDPRQHRAALRYIRKAMDDGVIYLSGEVDDKRYYAVREEK